MQPLILLIFCIQQSDKINILYTKERLKSMPGFGYGIYDMRKGKLLDGASVSVQGN